MSTSPLGLAPTTEPGHAENNTAISNHEIPASQKLSLWDRLWRAFIPFAKGPISSGHAASSTSSVTLAGAVQQAGNENISRVPTDEHIVDTRSPKVVANERLNKKCHVPAAFSLVKTSKEMGIKLLEAATISGAIVGVWYGVNALIKTMSSGEQGISNTPIQALANNETELALHSIENIKSLGEMAVSAIKSNNTQSATRILQTLQNNLNHVPSNANQALITAFLATSFVNPVISVLSGLISSAFTVARTHTQLTELEAIFETYKNRQKAYQEDFDSRPKDIQDAAREIDESVHADANAAINNSSGQSWSNNMALVNLIKYRMMLRFSLLTGRPDDDKECEKWKTYDGTKELMARRDKLMEMMPKEAKLPCKAFLTGTIAKSVKNKLPPEGHYGKLLYRDKNQENKVAKLDRDKVFEFNKTIEEQSWNVWSEVPKNQKTILGLVGSPGTGKTHFMKIVAELTERPVIPMVRPPEHQGGYQLFYPKTWDAKKQTKFMTALPDLLGELGMNMIESGYGNSIVFLDEADSGDMSGLKRFTDPATDTIENRCLGASQKFNNDIVVSTNYPFKELPTTSILSGDSIDTTEPAVASRMTQAPFVAADWMAKWKDARNAYHDISAKFCLPILNDVQQKNGAIKEGYFDAKLNEAQRNKLERIFRDNINYLVNKHHEKVPGLRLHAPVELIINFMVDRMLEYKYWLESDPQEREIKPVKDLEESEVKAVIDGYYKNVPNSYPYKEEKPGSKDADGDTEEPFMDALQHQPTETDAAPRPALPEPVAANKPAEVPVSAPAPGSNTNLTISEGNNFDSIHSSARETPEPNTNMTPKNDATLPEQDQTPEPSNSASIHSSARETPEPNMNMTPKNDATLPEQDQTPEPSNSASIRSSARETKIREKFRKATGLSLTEIKKSLTPNRKRSTENIRSESRTENIGPKAPL